MKLIPFCSFKGGVGKTTCLMAIASSLENRGYRIGLLEADDNRPLAGWKEDALNNGLWSDKVVLHDATSIEALQQSFEQAGREGVDYLLADTRGGACDLNTVLIANSTMIIVPTQLSLLDVRETIATLKFIAQTLQDNESDAPAIVLQTRVPARLNVSNRQAQEFLAQLPCFDRPMPERDSLQSQRKLGLLHQSAKILEKTHNRALEARQYAGAIEVVEGITDDIVELT